VWHVFRVQDLLRQLFKYGLVDRRKIGHFKGKYDNIMRGRSPEIILATPFYLYDTLH